MSKKIQLGQFYTKNQDWLTKPVLNFITQHIKDKKIILDPFAGEGDLLKTIKNKLTKKELKLQGFDIDQNLNWKINDSLIKIPTTKDTFIITNPPYLSKNSSSKKQLKEANKKYFNNSKYNDLYLIALEKIIEAKNPAVVIVPETFINSKFSKDFIEKIIIIEKKIFEDTDVPVCVICISPIKSNKTKIYKNDLFLKTLEEIKIINFPTTQQPLENLKFNSTSGILSLIAIDSTDPVNRIRFLNSENLNYDSSKIKNSSRAITKIDCPKFNSLSKKEFSFFIDSLNKNLNNYRTQTFDILLSPFKGNNKKNIRRRRLDYLKARKIINYTFFEIFPKK